MTSKIFTSPLRTFARAIEVAILRLSTGMKMLLILSLALLPLGLIALFASRESAHVNRLHHEAEARASAIHSAAILTDVFDPGTYGLRRAIDSLAASLTENPMDRRQCELRLVSLSRPSLHVRAFAVFDPNGVLICNTPDYVALPTLLPSGSSDYDIWIDGKTRIVRTNVSGDYSRYFGIAEFAADDIASLVRPSITHNYGLALHQGQQLIQLEKERARSPLDQIVDVSAPVAGGQLSLELRLPTSPISALEVLLILLPILMWAAGAVIGWFVVDRLLLRPLGEMQHAIAAFSAGKGPLEIPRLKTPASEIAALGESFVQATQALTRHEEELAEGLANQKRLTREVHHRVKNNLQVISSLISLHARGTSEPAISEAYASIQRRVDALSVVHRNHYAELEENFGISLRALIGEIASNLRASMNPAAGQTSMTLNLLPVSASQDIAVPIAFLITEIVELLMECGPGNAILITLAAIQDDPTRALLSVASPGLTSEACTKGAPYIRFERIAGGLARQMRSFLNFDAQRGEYSIEVNIIQGIIPPL